MARKNPIPSQKERLLEANAYRCCVCKRQSVGFHIHHIDSDSSNTVDTNLAVLCVEDHDRHHRPAPYSPRHQELSAEEIRCLKASWEAFIVEARKPTPKVLATLSAFGTIDQIHSLQLVMQWPDEKIEYVRSYHLLNGDLDRLTDEVLQEIAEIGDHIKLASIDEPLPIEHCECCGSGLSRTVKEAVAMRLTDPSWSVDSVCSIYINPDKASLALLFSLGERHVLSASLHLCEGRYLHYKSDGVGQRIPINMQSSVRVQAVEIVKHILKEWEPATIFLGTGDADRPELVSALELPTIWERGLILAQAKRKLRKSLA